MALAQINPIEEKKKKSPLETFATGLQIAGGIGNIGLMAKKLNEPSEDSALLKFLKSRGDK